MLHEDSISEDRFEDWLGETINAGARTGSPTEFVRVVFAATADAVLGPELDPPHVQARLPHYRAVSAESPPPRVRHRVELGVNGCMNEIRRAVDFESRRIELSRRYNMGAFDVDDLMSEALLRTCVRVATIRTSLGGYFWQVADNLGKRRSRGRDLCSTSDDELEDEQASTLPLPDELIHNRQCLDALRKQLCALDPDQRRILELHIGHGRTFAQIAVEFRSTQGKAAYAYYQTFEIIRNPLKSMGCCPN